MKIRSKLITSFFIAVTVPVVILVVTTTAQTFSQSRAYFIDSTQQEIKQIDNTFEIFFEGMKEHVRFMASDERLIATGNTTITSYVGVEKDMTPLQNGAIEAEIFRFHGQFREQHPNLLNVYMGSETGGFIQYPPERMNNYDPRKRPWYQSAKQAPGQAIITSPYQGISGGPMISVAITIAGPSGAVVGVQSIDVTLDTLTRLINEIRLGENGYVILIDDNGVVLADPRNTANNFKNIRELSGSPLYAAIAKQTEQSFTVDQPQGEVTVTTYRSPQLKWRFVGVIDSADIEAPAWNIVRTMMVVLVLMLVGCALLGVFLANRIVAPIFRVSASLKGIADGRGDLTQRLDVRGNDEVSELATYFNAFMDSIRDLVSEIKHQADSLHQSSNTFNSMAKSLRHASDKQESSIEMTAAATNEMAAAAQEVARNCVTTQTATEDTGQASQSGTLVIRDAVKQVEQLMQFTQDSTAAMKQLESESDNINQILNVIRGIAEQTNLLALNAAIEAARAGEQGRGFAVVADEVRTLAQRSHGATEEINGMLNNLVERTRFVSGKMSASLGQSEQATEQSNQARAIFEQIGDLLQGIRDQIAQISAAAEQQYKVSGDISRNITGMQASTKEVGQASRGLSDTSHDLLALSQRLNDLVGRFKL